MIHSALYHNPGSLKARLCVEGSAAIVRFCEEHEISYAISGKIIVATAESELPDLQELLRRGRANGVPDMHELSVEEIREMKPNALGRPGVHVPTTGITNFKMVSAKYAELIEQAGGTILASSGVQWILREMAGIVLETAFGPAHTRFLVNCAGCRSTS